MSSQEQLFLKNTIEPRLVHGGNLARGKRKTSRPFQAKAPLHLVLQSKRAKGRWTLAHRKHHTKILRMIYVYASRFQVKVNRASVTGHQIHLLLKASEKKHLSDYLRVLAGRVAVTITGAQKCVKRVGRFWDHLFFSRMINWGRDFHQVRQFLRQVTEAVDAHFEEEDFYWKKIPIG